MKYLILLVLLALISCKTNYYTIIDSWQECIDNSDGSDGACQECDDKFIQLDLPEEYSQATESDTLIAIKKGRTLYVQFNNQY